MHKHPALLFFHFPFFLNKSFFKITPAKHQTNVRSILQSHYSSRINITSNIEKETGNKVEKT